MAESTNLSVESSAVQKHLEIMQGVITRMAENSRSCKVWCVTLVAIGQNHGRLLRLRSGSTVLLCVGTGPLPTTHGGRSHGTGRGTTGKGGRAKAMSPHASNHYLICKPHFLRLPEETADIMEA